MRNIPLLDLKEQYQKIKPEIEAKVQKVLEEANYVLGPEVKEFEANVAAYCDAKFGVGVNSGTDALHLPLAALKVGPGDEVITTPFTFFATSEVISVMGAKPVFCDIQADTFNIDPEQIKAKITPKTKGIVPVHLYGHPAEMDAIMAIAREHNLWVLEDCAQSLGSSYKGKKTGSFGVAGAISFFPSKNLGAYGDGGMIVTSDQEMAEELKALRVHGGKKRYFYETLGFNSRLDTIQAPILNIKLKYLNQWNERRREIAAFYSENLAQIPGVVPPSERPGCYHIYHQYTFRAPKRDELQKHLQEKGIGNAIYYPLALHLQEVYSNLGYKKGDLPVTEKAQDEVISLPIYPELKPEDLEYIVGTIKEFF